MEGPSRGTLHDFLSGHKISVVVVSTLSVFMLLLMFFVLPAAFASFPTVSDVFETLGILDDERVEMDFEQFIENIDAGDVFSVMIDTEDQELTVRLRGDGQDYLVEYPEDYPLKKKLDIFEIEYDEYP